MATQIVQDSRIRKLNDADVRNGRYVLYWMQQSQRAEGNHALEYAIQRANERGEPLVVGFGLTESYPEANLRHYTFMLEGLQETVKALERRGIRMVVRLGDPVAVALELAESASLVVTDRGYLRHQVRWRERVAAESPCEVVRVESDVIVPVDEASDHAEYAARTLRPKLHARAEDYLVELRTTPLESESTDIRLDSLDLEDLGAVLDRLDLDRTVPAVSSLYRGGTSQARAVLRSFVEDRLPTYAKNRNQPQTDDVSCMGMYLHFGQISPLYVALRILESGAGDENVEGFIEELLVRRELSVNFVRYTPDYDAFTCLPDWARASLERHRDDRRRHTYTAAELEDAQTHDPYWNAAMREMRHTGYMHNYMRMYWGKKILEWSRTPEGAFRTALKLNNRYFLDGRDPNSYAGVAWVFGKHDRAWAERKIYGKVRTMTARGLERKCDIDGYVEKVDRRVAEHGVEEDS